MLVVTHDVCEGSACQVLDDPRQDSEYDFLIKIVITICSSGPSWLSFFDPRPIGNSCYQQIWLVLKMVLNSGAIFGQIICSSRSRTVSRGASGLTRTLCLVRTACVRQPRISFRNQHCSRYRVNNPTAELAACPEQKLFLTVILGCLDRRRKNSWL